MKQETINQTNHNTFNASFHQKSAGLSLVIISSAALYFVARAWPMRPAALSSNTLPVGYGGLVLTTLLLIIVGQIVLQSVLAIGQWSISAARVGEKMAGLKARRHGYFVLAAGILAVIGSAFVEALTLFDTTSLAILSLILAVIVQQASLLFYTRR